MSKQEDQAITYIVTHMTNQETNGKIIGLFSDLESAQNKVENATISRSTTAFQIECWDHAPEDQGQASFPETIIRFNVNITIDEPIVVEVDPSQYK